MMGRVPTKPGASSASETTGNQVSAWGLLPQLPGSAMRSGAS